jgi:hypothetical protein
LLQGVVTVTDTQPRPFDERAALDELERLAEKIQSTRRQRERAVAEFNAFVKTFKDEDHAARWNALKPPARAETAALSPPAALPPPAALVTAPAPIAPTIAERRAPAPHVPAIAIESPAAVLNDAEPLAWSAPRRSPLDVATLLGSSRGRLGLAAAGLVVLVLVVSWLWSRSSATPAEGQAPAAAPAAQTPAPASAPAAAPAEPTPVASTGPARALNLVLMTSRPVWTRVTVDDRKVIERELPGSQTIPLGADRAIVIRAGDAGAIRVVVDGKDLGVLGRDGQIASRSFTARAK